MADETDRIRADVEATRDEMGETARVLARELDPRLRARRSVMRAGDRARQRLDPLVAAVRADPAPAAAALAAAVLLLGLRRRR